MISLPNFSPCQVMTRSINVSVDRSDLGSARVSRVGEGVLAFADFSCGVAFRKDCLGGTPKPARGTRALLRARQSTLKLIERVITGKRKEFCKIIVSGDLSKEIAGRVELVVGRHFQLPELFLEHAAE